MKKELKNIKKNITIEKAKDVWKQLGNNDYIKTIFPIICECWRNCQRINNLPEKEWQDLVERNQKKLKSLKKGRKFSLSH